jgi:phospholipid/cholesterol/gamma-HCH transport system substrate-binding protein
MRAITRKRRTDEQRDSRLGILGTALVLVVAAVALNADSISPLLADRTLHAVFAEAGGLGQGDSVVVSGTTVGEVLDVELRDTDVLVTFTVDQSQLHLGTLSRAEIKARSALGKKALTLTPAGAGQLADGAEIPLERTTPPYDISQALQELTGRASDVDTGRLATAMNTVSDAFSGTSQSVPGALNGVRRLAESVNARDAELRELLKHANDTTQVLAAHDGDLRAIFDQGTSLLSALNDRQATIQQLLGNLTAVSDQLTGLARENDAQLGPALADLNGVLTILRQNRDNVTAALGNAVPLLRELGEVVSSMPALDAYIANIPPTNLVPTVPQLLGGQGGQGGPR